MLQRHPEAGHPDDDGVYIEIDDQIHAAFSIVERCELTTNSIHVSLSRPLKGFTTLGASLALQASELAELQRILTRIFVKHESL